MSYVKPTLREIPLDVEHASCCGPTVFLGKITFGGNCRPLPPPPVEPCTAEICVVTPVPTCTTVICVGS